MITDALTLVSASQVVTATAVSTNTIDLLQARELGDGEEIEFYVNVEQTVTAAGAATLTIQVITSASANLSTPTVLEQTDAIPKASLAAPQTIFLKVFRAFINTLGQRYLGLNYVVATGPLTAGIFSAGLLIDGQSKAAKAYPAGFVVA